VTIRLPNEKKPRQYKVLREIEFDSTRKRMSVLVQDMQHPDCYILLTKGADSIIEKLLRKKTGKTLKSTKKLIDKWAEVGLRTLMLAKREFTSEFFEDWN